MNTIQNLLKRLLRMYPVKIVKEHFNQTGNSEEILNFLVNNRPANTIKDFAYTNVENTKQHICIYRLNNNFNVGGFIASQFPYQIVNQTVISNGISLVISPNVSFNAVLGNPFQEVILDFYQPFIITIFNRTLIFQMTILEKDIGSYIDPGRVVYNVEKINNEEIIIADILPFFAHYQPIRADLNRGVKFLWANDRIDSRYAKWKKNRSTATETMDENYTLKEQYPDIYVGLINDPLKRMIFRYLPNDELFPDHFTCDPSRGEISVPLYPKTPNQIQNVIHEILSNN